MPEIPPDSPLSESFLLCFWCEKKLLPFQHFPYDGYPLSLFSFSHPSPFSDAPLAQNGTGSPPGHGPHVASVVFF